MLNPGQRFRSAVSEAEVVLVRVPADVTELLCGGVPMVPVGTSVDVVPAAAAADVVLSIGKRYSNAAGDFEALVTKGGTGGLSVGGEALDIRAARALPSSD